MFSDSLHDEDTPVSVGLLQRVQSEGAVTIRGLADMWSIEPHSVYPYLTNREMRYGQMRTLYRRARDRRIQEAFHADLMQGTGWTAVFIDADLDFDGDGDVDTDDVMAHAIDALGKLAKYLETLRATNKPDMALLGQLTQRVIQGVVTSERCAQHIADAHSRRRQAHPLNAGVNGKGGVR
jgi:hypothetical protein